MSFLLGWRALGRRSAEEFDSYCSQLQFGELLNEVLFSALETPLATASLKMILRLFFGLTESR